MFPHQNLPFLLKILRGKYAARMAWTAESPYCGIMRLYSFPSQSYLGNTKIHKVSIITMCPTQFCIRDDNHPYARYLVDVQTTADIWK